MNKNKNRNSNFKNFKSNKKGNGKKNFNDSDFGSSRESNRKFFGAPINDIKWYRDNEQLLNDVCRVPYNIPVGMPIHNDGEIYNTPDQQYSVPGLISCEIVPTYGKCDSPTDPVNVAFNGMFTFIRSHVSGTNFTWDANTLGINLLATDSIYWTIKWYTRLYASLPLFHQSNKYLCRDLIIAQGVDYDDFLAHSAEFRAQINMRIARVNALKIPSELYVFARHQWLFENYYIEGPSTKDQIYFYRPAAFYVYGYDSDDKPMLSCHRYLAGATGQDGLLTASDLIKKLDAMLDPIYNDQYFNLISGFIEKAYEGKVMQLSYLPDQAVMPLVYSEEVLLQFKNTKAFQVAHALSGPGYYDDSFNVYQVPTSLTDPRIHLKCMVTEDALKVYRLINDGSGTHVASTSPSDEQYNFNACAQEYSKDVMITSPHADVIPAENMINTRNIPVVHFRSASTGIPDVELSYLEWGADWPIAIEIYARYWDNNDNEMKMFHRKMHYVNVFDASKNDAYLVPTRILPMISVYKYFPELRLVYRAVDGQVDPTAVAQCYLPFFELDNYAIIKPKDIAMMHESAILSMMRVPEVASTSLNGR